MSFTDVGQPRRSSKDVKGDWMTALTQQQMSTRATPCVSYWAAYYINRDGGCDALGRTIQCETEKLALSVARYRRRRLQPLRGGNANLARTEKQYGRDGAGHALLFPRKFGGFSSLTPTSGLAYASGPSSFQTRGRGNLGRSTPDMTHKLTKCRISPSTRASFGPLRTTRDVCACALSPVAGVNREPDLHPGIMQLGCAPLRPRLGHRLKPSSESRPKQLFVSRGPARRRFA